jgi:hypothetical protein
MKKCKASERRAGDTELRPSKKALITTGYPEKLVN